MQVTRYLFDTGFQFELEALNGTLLYSAGNPILDVVSRRHVKVSVYLFGYGGTSCSRTGTKDTTLLSRTQFTRQK